MKILKTYTAIVLLGCAVIACNDSNQADHNSSMDSSSVPAGPGSQYPSTADDQTVTPLDTIPDSSHLNGDTLTRDATIRNK